MDNTPELNINPVKESKKSPDPVSEYEKRASIYSNEAKKLAKQVNLLSNLRLLVFITGFGLSFYLYMAKLNSFGTLVLSLTIITFLYLVFTHDKYKREWKYKVALEGINVQALKRLAGDWKEFNDRGQEFKDENHPYSGDLDIFGKGSLFQWLSAAGTYLGRVRLKEYLTSPINLNPNPNPNLDASNILIRQETVKELARHLDWRQQFQAEGSVQSKNNNNPEYLFHWSKKSHKFYSTMKVLILFRILPLITAALLVSAWLIPNVSFSWAVSMLAFQFLLLFYKGKERGEALSTISKYKEDIKTYYKMLSLFETSDFTSEYLNNLKNALITKKKLRGYKQIEKLERLADWIDNRNNAIFLPINILFLADYQFMIALEKWREESGRLLEIWLKTIAELEALSSLAIIPFDHPDWVWPRIAPAGTFIEALELGHPLITKRVSNDLNIKNQTKVLLITGSNMSGKSTLLRTAGINLVLAYTGAPVCAKEFSCSIMSIYTCMRVSDNLEKNVSSFYAELLKIKQIVEACQTEKQVFFLLDEIFKGTNSIDRHAGAEILINKLIKQGAGGMVSTHDLELTELERMGDQVIKNYHFREYYTNEQIQFDYKLRSGVSTTRNARYLMKIAGIE